MIDRSIEQQTREHRGKGQRPARIGFDQQIVMCDAGNRHEIGQAMQQLPARWTESPDHPVGRSDRQRHHQQETRDADLQINPHDEFMHGTAKI